jgi:hypothetical protein
MSQVHELETATLLMLAPGTMLSSVGTRARQTSMGTLLCTAVRGALEADACLFNGGGIRGAREYHAHLTYGDLKSEVAFDNEIVTVTMPGEVLREAIAASRAHAPAESGSFLQVDDGLVVDEQDVAVAVAGAPLDPSRLYQVALVRELLFGLDHIEPLVRWARGNPAAIPPPDSGREGKAILVEAFSLSLWRAMGGFDAVDADHDGVVTEAEVFTAEARVTGEAGSHLTAGLLMRALDRDHDGTISREEGARLTRLADGGAPPDRAPPDKEPRDKPPA